MQSVPCPCTCMANPHSRSKHTTSQTPTPVTGPQLICSLLGKPCCLVEGPSPAALAGASTGAYRQLLHVLAVQPQPAQPQHRPGGALVSHIRTPQPLGRSTLSPFCSLLASSAQGQLPLPTVTPAVTTAPTCTLPSGRCCRRTTPHTSNGPPASAPYSMAHGGDRPWR